MDEELIIVQVQEENDSATVEDLSLDIEQSETVEYIEVDEPEEITIEIEEAIGSPSIGDGNYAPLEHTHQIDEIEELSNTLYGLASAKDHHSAHGGYAEFRPWLKEGYYQTDDIYQNTGGVGYFVSLVTATESKIDGNNVYVDICKKKNSNGIFEVTDVYGVTVANSGFYGYQDVGYDALTTTKNRAHDSSYAKVCLLGNVEVRISSEDHKNILIGDYVVPNEHGYAKKSDNNIGFKVISKGQIEGVGSTVTAWYYVEIALVPQNDNIARVMKEIENTNVNLEGITIQLGNMSDKITDMEGSNIQLGEEFKGLEDLVNESTNKINTQLPEMEQMLQDAKDIANEASKTINDVALEYAEAVNKADEAREAIYGEDGVLKDIEALQEDMQPLADWQGKDGSKGVASFVAQAEEDRTQLASLTKAFGEDGSNLTAIIQKIDENGAAIQHLVSHVDKYILGETSPTNGLTSDETSIMQPGTIYIPTVDGEEFKYGKSYIWKANDTGTYIWANYKDVFTFSDVAEFDAIDLKKDDLWYCWQGVMNGDKYLYNPGILYCWDGQIWVPVASANDGTSSVVSLINQTAKKLTSTYTNLKGDISSIEQEVESIRTTVENMDSGSLSQIEQTAAEIRLGVYKPDEGSSQFGLLLDGMQSMSNYGGRVCIKHVIDDSPITANKYTQSPIWNGEEFVFAEGALREDGIYYPHPTDKDKYCKIVSDGYEIYTIGNEARALLQTEVDNNKAAITGFTEFKTETDSRITNVEQLSNANEAKITSVVAGEYVVCVDINLEPTEEELAQITSAAKYKSAPEWVDGKFVFNEDDVNADGIYYMLEGDDIHYYKLLSNGQSYEQYEIDSSGLASIIQKVTKDGSSIGLLVGDDGVQGSILVEAINEQSSATINADRINLEGYVTVTSLGDGGTTVIDGSRIITGSIKSRNYEAPLEEDIFAQAGTKIDLDSGAINSEGFNLDDYGNASITGRITARSGFIGDEENGFTIGYHDQYYALTNNQTSLMGDYSRNTEGVYIGPNGIGLGNGAFAIDSSGNLNTVGDITMWAKDADSSDITKVLEIDSDTGNLTLAGNVTLGGNITLSGNITWDASNSPICVLYAKTALSKPTKIWLDDDGNYNYGASATADVWHRVYQAEKDYYASYSYDGGKTWTDAIKIIGTDGEPGSSGSNDVTDQYIFNMLTSHGDNQGLFGAFQNKQSQVFINAQYIYGKTVGGLTVFSEDSDGNNITLGNGLISLTPSSATNPKMKIGFGVDDSDQNYPDTPFMSFGQGNGKKQGEMLEQTAYWGQAWLFKSIDGLHINLLGEDEQIQGIHFFDYGYGTAWDDSHISFGSSKVDFTYATVKGLKITFG